MKYIQKRLIVEAIQFLGNDKECLEFCPTARAPEDDKASLIIPTFEGDVLCNYGDYIVKYDDGDYSIYNPETFSQYYFKHEEPALVACSNCKHWGNISETFLGECKELLQSGSMLSDTGNVIPPLLTQFDFSCKLYQEKI